MKRSTEKILTTHTGSLPRPGEVVDLLLAREEGRADADALEAAVGRAIEDVVEKQVEAGIDVINDGEQGRPDYTTHVKDRLTGYDGPSSPPLGTGDESFPELAEMLAQFASPLQNRPACSGPVAWKDWPAAQADVERARSVLGRAGTEEAFMTSPSPGQISRYLRNLHYASEEEYIFALAEVMRREYEAIVEAGLILQLDCPDLALSRHTVFRDLSLAEFRKEIEMHVEALNHAVRNIAPERMRMHVCWGSTLGPHHEDVPLKDVVDVVLKGRPCAVSFPGANPRHGHEWAVWREVDLPAGKCIIPGVIDSTSNFVEHPELVAERIVRYAEVVGRENVLAGVDCGFRHLCGPRAGGSPHRVDEDGRPGRGAPP